MITHLSYIDIIHKAMHYFHLEKGQPEHQSPWASCYNLDALIQVSF